MRTIPKDEAPECLVAYQGSSNWQEISTACKHELAEQCFVEQNGLCIYCERDLESPDLQKNAHCEHLVPRETKTRVFDYQNICLSCYGTPPVDSNELDAYQAYDRSCGKARDNKPWNPELFIHLCDEKAVELRFKWNTSTQCIEAKKENDTTATEMINLLKLNNPYLISTRQKARGVFRKALSESGNDSMLENLRLHKLEYSSFLKSIYSDLF